MRTVAQIHDEWLVLRSQAGDVRGFEELVNRWHGRLRRHVMRLTEGHDDSADIMQDIWVTVVKKLRRLDDPACFPQWAYRIATARCADWVRKQQRDRGLLRTVSENESADEVIRVNDPESATGMEILRKAVARLSVDQRVILNMFYLDELSTADISAALAIPVGTVKSRLYHARIHLRKIIERCDP